MVTLIENTPGAPGCLFEHGLSFYAETKNHKILADTGASGAFLKNAQTLGIDLRQVDTVVISHGHYDHGGGLLEFAALNPTAKIYLSQRASGAFYHLKDEGEKYIGLDPGVFHLPGLCLTEGNVKLDEELSLFSGVLGRRLWPAGNRRLKRKEKERYLQDSFDHEQCLVISQGEKKILISGCAHNGILNILDRFQEVYGRGPDVVISGFHMKKDGDYTEEEEHQIRQTARLLKETGALFYTGHCTGLPAFERMKEIMGNRLLPLHSGEELFLEESKETKYEEGDK